MSTAATNDLERFHEKPEEIIHTFVVVGVWAAQAFMLVRYANVKYQISLWKFYSLAQLASGNTQLNSLNICLSRSFGFETSANILSCTFWLSSGGGRVASSWHALMQFIIVRCLLPFGSMNKHLNFCCFFYEINFVSIKRLSINEVQLKPKGDYTTFNTLDRRFD